MFELPSSTTHMLLLSREEAERQHSAVVATPHLLMGILRQQGRAAMVLKDLSVDAEWVAQQMTHESHNSIGNVNSNTNATVNEQLQLNDDCMRVMRLSFLEARAFGASRPLSEHVLLALLRDTNNEAQKWLSSAGVTYEAVAHRLGKPFMTTDAARGSFADSPASDNDDDDGFRSSAEYSETQAAAPTGNGSDTPFIDKFGTDLTRLAREGKLDPVVGRERETARMAQILCRRKKNNPIIIGEPGVGKSALVEGLAMLISSGRVARQLRDHRIVSLDMAALVAGTQYRGQFEERLRKLIEELRNHPEIILFIDEIHTMIGAGGAQGSLDAAGMLKPALARGEVQCIGATTLDEFRKSIEKDGALERRFQKIVLQPATPDETLTILRNLRGRYEEHHGVSYTDEALQACVSLTARYVSDRCLPDKAIDAMDEAGSRARLEGIEVPAEITEMEDRINHMQREKIKAASEQDFERAIALRDEMVELQQKLKELQASWQLELQKNSPTITEADIAAVVEMMSGVPASQMAEAESIRLRGMAAALKKRIIGQDEAIDKVARCITRNRLGLKDPNKPIGTFMLVGPTGVGKTYMVQQLAEFMFGSKDALIRIDMSEYGEKFSTSRLVGAPPGYVGYDEGGQLTERVRRRPYSIVLLDEIEKAHPDVWNTLLQVMDEGRMTDSNGVTVDFRNTVIIMTSNSGTRQLREFGGGIGFKSNSGNAEQAEHIVRKALQKQFAPEFLNRVDDVIMFRPLNDEDARKIAALELGKLSERMNNIGLTLNLTDEAMNFLVERGFDKIYGARSLRRALQTYVEDVIADALMEETSLSQTEFVLDVANNKQSLVIRKTES